MVDNMPRALWFAIFLFACDDSKKAAQPGAGAPMIAAAPPSAQAITGDAPRAKRPKDHFDVVEVNVPTGKSSLHVAWKLPGGTGINDEAPFGVRWVSSDGLAVTPNDIAALGKDVAKGFEIPVELMTGTSGAKLAGDLDMVVCDVATHAVCVPIRRQLEITLNPSKGSSSGSVVLGLPSAR